MVSDLDEARLVPGQTAVRRFVLNGVVWTAIPTRVVSDDEHGLAVAHWQGVQCRMPASYVDAAMNGRSADRFRLIDDLAAGEWTMRELAWSQTSVLTLMQPEEWFSMSLFRRATTHEMLCWYVNFEEPFTRTAIGIDTNDLFIDLVVEPDGGYRWKDEDEYQHARRIGLITEGTHLKVERARERAVSLVYSGIEPLTGIWGSWRPGAEWATPQLPGNWA